MNHPGLSKLSKGLGLYDFKVVENEIRKRMNKKKSLNVKSIYIQLEVTGQWLHAKRL